VRFIIFEIFETGVLERECPRSSRTSELVQDLRAVRFVAPRLAAGARFIEDDRPIEEPRFIEDERFIEGPRFIEDARLVFFAM
jgi:hypothetical protein